MTNKEQYKMAFSVLRLPDDFSPEVKNVEKVRKQQKFRHAVAAAALCVLLLGGGTTAYAENVGGIQRTIQLWIHGEQTNATIQFDGDGSYSMEYTDADGNTRNVGGGGVKLNRDGSAAPVSEDELLEHLRQPDVQYEEDGSVWVYWGDQKLDITDKFQDGVCYVKLEGGNETLYLTVKYQGGYAISPNKYIDPSTFK